MLCSLDWRVHRSAGGGLVLAPLCCDKKWCQDCARAWSRDYTGRLAPAVRSLPPRSLRHIVLTIPNVQRNQLRAGLDDLFATYREWRNQGRRAGWWDPRGYCSKLEINWSQRAAWHPHFHVLAHTPDGFEFRAGSPARETWSRLTKARFGKAAVALWITRPQDNTAAAVELAKYCAKPLQFAVRPFQLAELADSLHGRRIISHNGSLSIPPPKPKPKQLTYLGTLSQLLRGTAPGDLSEQMLAAVDALEKLGVDTSDAEAFDEARVRILGELRDAVEDAGEAGTRPRRNG